MNYAKDGGDYLSIAIACLDSSYKGKPTAHCFTESKAPWHELSTSIPNFKALPENL